jgi:hypothetical protein
METIRQFPLFASIVPIPFSTIGGMYSSEMFPLIFFRPLGEVASIPKDP